MKIFKNLGLLDIIEKLEVLFYKVYGSEECRVCKERIKCSTSQFIRKDKRVQCTQCKRYLETVREK